MKATGVVSAKAQQQDYAWYDVEAAEFSVAGAGRGRSWHLKSATGLEVSNGAGRLSRT